MWSAIAKLSDTGLIILAVVVFLIVVGILVIVFLLRGNRDALLEIPTAWGPFRFSPDDASRLLHEVYGRLSKEDIEALREFDRQSRPNNRIPGKIDQKTLDKFVGKRLVEDPDPEVAEDNYDPSRLRLAYAGWQVLSSYLNNEPLVEPRWPNVPVKRVLKARRRSR